MAKRDDPFGVPGVPDAPGAATPAALRAAAWVMSCLGGCSVPERETAELAARLERRMLPPGAAAFTQGQAPEGVWILRSGMLELAAGSGRHRVVVGVLQSSGIVGDVPLLTGRPAVCTVRALTDVQAAYLPAAAFLTLLKRSPALTRAWLTGLALRHSWAHQAQAQTVGGTAEGRVARLLLREARDGTVTCSQGTLAAMLGLRRPTLNRVLKDFERDGLLRVGYRKVELLDQERLAPRAGLPD